MRTRWKRALRATARVALGSSALGLALPACGGETSSSTGGVPGTGGALSAIGGESDTSTGGELGAGATGGNAAVGGAPSAGGDSGVTPGGAGGDAPVCVGPIELTRPSLAPGPSEDELTCCLDLVTQLVRNSTPLGGRELAANEPYANCCRAIITAVDLNPSLYNPTTTVTADACCMGANGTNPEIYLHALCTPWGPPVPPSIDWQPTPPTRSTTRRDSSLLN